MSSDPQTLRNVADVWLATAFASSVFPINANGKFYAAMTALSLITPRACARGKVIGRVIVVASRKIAVSRGLGT